ncbi:MAG TPA: anti-sigma factor [Acidimicrobiia bacterium]|nr:anti-sigma factor [Acidimicrobiia bacterium]
MNEFEEFAAPYLLGALEPEERRRFEAHLLECSECTALVNDLAQGVIALDHALAVEPPAGLRTRVLDGIKSVSETSVVELAPRRRPLWRLAWIAAAVLVVLLGGLTLFNPNPLDQLMAAADARTVELAVHEAFAAPPPQQAQVVFSESEEAAAVEFRGLASPEEGNTYQLWLIGEGDPAPAGVFVPDETGEATALLQGEARSGLLVAITQEPAGGLPAPSGEVLFSAEL